MWMREVSIYADGACSGNPGPGGWGAVLIFGDQKKEISGSEEKTTTNNRMEMTALIEGLKLLKEPCLVKVYSDSAYLINAFKENWIGKWQRNGWVNSKKEQVENQDLWEQIIDLTASHQVEWNKIKGHAGNFLNERCDHLAKVEVKEEVKEEAKEDSK
jgi:ribonuclease HI